MACKCCGPGCTSNYNSADKEWKCSTLVLQQDPVIRQNWLHRIPIDCCQHESQIIPDFVSSIYKKYMCTLKISIQIMIVLYNRVP